MEPPDISLRSWLGWRCRLLEADAVSEILMESFTQYARQHLLSFMFRHGRIRRLACFFFPVNSVPTPPQPFSLVVVTSSSSPRRPDPLTTDYGTIDDLCDLCIDYGAISVLEEVVSSRISMSRDQSENQHSAAAVACICLYRETHKYFNYLYKFQVIKKDHLAAGLCCIQLFPNSASQEEALKHLEHAKMYFDEGLSARYRVGDYTELVTKGIWGKTASEKLTEEGLVKYSARIVIQAIIWNEYEVTKWKESHHLLVKRMSKADHSDELLDACSLTKMDVVRCFSDAEGQQWKHTLFGNPIDPETFRRRCEISETLGEKKFDLAFQVVYEFNLPGIYHV